MAIPKIMFAGGGERGQYLTHKGNDTTIRFVLKYPGRIDPDILRQAVKAASSMFTSSIWWGIWRRPPMRSLRISRT